MKRPVCELLLLLLPLLLLLLHAPQQVSREGFVPLNKATQPGLGGFFPVLQGDVEIYLGDGSGLVSVAVAMEALLSPLSTLSVEVCNPPAPVLLKPHDAAPPPEPATVAAAATAAAVTAAVQ